MKILVMLLGLSFALTTAFAQRAVSDEAIRYQEERMVFKQWDQDKFKPSKGFLSLNPYYWLVWGLFHPSYHNTDLRPLSVTGPQTQRLALVGSMNSIDNNYKLNADTVRNTALSQIAATTGTISGADPLWLLYYNQQFKPLLNYSITSILGPLPAQVSTRLVSEGTYDWYANELAMLKERVQAAHSADMDRSSRIMAYYRLLKEYRVLAGVWAIRTSVAQKGINMTTQQQRLHTGQATIPGWTPNTDVQIANGVLARRQY